MKLVTWLVAGAMFTASCDIILNVQIGGTVRISQLLLLLVCFAALGHALQNGRILWFRGATALALWLLAQLLFVPLNSSTIVLEFFALLCFTVITVFAMVQLYGASPRIEQLMRIYLLSYVFVGAFGLVQFFMPLLGLPGVLVTQWILHGRLARINGFSYEPSYFATYMIMGWIMLIELRVSRARLVQGRFWTWSLVIVTAALVLSTSKTAWIFVLFEALLRVVPVIRRSVRRALEQLKQRHLLVPVPKAYQAVGALVVFVCIAAGLRSVTRLVNPVVFLAGTGLANTPAHSFVDRQTRAHETWAAWEASPFLGRTLGGVPIYLAGKEGVTITSAEQVRGYWGFPVIFDVLAASGVFGFALFLIFLWHTTLGPLRLARRCWPEERARWLRALGRAMIFEWLLLMVDQNLLRVYVWLHMTMVCIVAYHLEFAPALAAEPSGNTVPISALPAFESQ